MLHRVAVYHSNINVVCLDEVTKDRKKGLHDLAGTLCGSSCSRSDDGHCQKWPGSAIARGIARGGDFLAGLIEKLVDCLHVPGHRKLLWGIYPSDVRQPRLWPAVGPARKPLRARTGRTEPMPGTRPVIPLWEKRRSGFRPEVAWHQPGITSKRG